MSGVKQDLTDDRQAVIQVESPEEAFRLMLAAEDGTLPETLPKVEEDEPKPDSGEEPEEGEETAEEPEVPAEEESDDPAVEESDDLPEQEQEPVTETLIDVQVNGETVQVTQDELQKGYAREADYTRHKQEVAEEQRALGEDRQAVQAERAKYDGMLEQLQEIIEQSLPQEPDWTKLRAENPDDFGAVYAEWTQRKGQLEKVQAERQRVWQQEQVDQQAAQGELIEQERVKLQTALPELFDADKSQKLGSEMLETATGIGYTPDEVSAVLDSRALRLLHDATQFRLLQKKGKVVSKKAKNTPTVRPGAARPAAPARTRKREAESRLKKSGKVEDAAAVFLQDMRVKRSG